MRKVVLPPPLIVITYFAIALTLTSVNQTVFANGAVWNPGSNPGTPGPMKNKDLILLKEHVVFHDDPDHRERTVFAEFWIYNPTQKDVHATMGFPLIFTDDEPGYQSRSEYLSEFSKKFVVKISDTRVNAKPAPDGVGRYSIVYTWDMLFPAVKTTRYTVEYPLTFSFRGEDQGTDDESSRRGSEESQSFTYITHTGAYWAKPIVRATFEYCSADLINLMLRAPSGETTTEKTGHWENMTQVSTVTDRWSVKPKPYEINTKDGCVVWTRQDWTPRNPEDDIVVSTHHESYSDYSEESSEQSWTAPPQQPPQVPKPPSIEKDMKLDNLFKKWCAGPEKGDKVAHFGAAEQITEKKLTGEIYYDMWERAFYYPERKATSQFGWQFSELPPDIRTAFQIQLLRYLRNYIFAVHSHVFKDQQLAQCFQNVSKSTSTKLSNVEKWNVDWLLDYEKQLKK